MSLKLPVKLKVLKQEAVFMDSLLSSFDRKSFYCVIYYLVFLLHECFTKSIREDKPHDY